MSYSFVLDSHNTPPPRIPRLTRTELCTEPIRNMNWRWLPAGHAWKQLQMILPWGVPWGYPKLAGWFFWCKIHQWMIVDGVPLYFLGHLHILSIWRIGMDWEWLLMCFVYNKTGCCCTATICAGDIQQGGFTLKDLTLPGTVVNPEIAHVLYT